MNTKYENNCNNKMSKQVLQDFRVFQHTLKNILVSRGTCLTLIKGLIQTLDNVTGNNSTFKDPDSFYELIDHSMNLNYITHGESVSIMNDVISNLENDFTPFNI